MCNIADIAFVLDSSGSIGRSDWSLALDFVTSLVSQLTIGPNGVRVAAVTYGNTATVNFDLEQCNNTESLIEAIQDIDYKNANTNTSGGLWLMKERIFNQMYGDRPEAPNLGKLCYLCFQYSHIKCLKFLGRNNINKHVGSLVS